MDDSWYVNIEKVYNGYIMKTNTAMSEEESITVIEEKADDNIEWDNQERHAEVKAAADLLYEIKEHFAVYNSKHEKYNIRIIIEGDENE